MLIEPTYLVVLVVINPQAIRLLLDWVRAQQRRGAIIPDWVFKPVEMKYPEYGQVLALLRQTNLP